ncbi:MAG TPA: type II toxin-antitoxin system RelE/ParE family toxin [Candidatus Dojkabacteria bacterium]|jgi:mRNA interferase RelE/StbE
MSYKILFSKKVLKDIRKIPKPILIRIKERILSLQTDPRPNTSTKLSGQDNLYRIRINNYRVIYTIQDSIRIITIIKIAHRKKVYRNF